MSAMTSEVPSWTSATKRDSQGAWEESTVPLISIDDFLAGNIPDTSLDDDCEEAFTDVDSAGSSRLSLPELEPASAFGSVSAFGSRTNSKESAAEPASVISAEGGSWTSYASAAAWKDWRLARRRSSVAPKEATMPLVSVDDFLSGDAPIPPMDMERRKSDVNWGLLNRTTRLIRDAKLGMACLALDVKERYEKKTSDMVKNLVYKPEEDAGQISETSQVTNSVRSWVQICAAAHATHSKEEPEVPEDSCGCLEVKFLAFGSEPEVCLERSGYPASEPALQLVCERSITGAMHPADCLEDDQEKNPFARFHIQELAHCDLYVYVWDRNNSNFSLGFEDAAFCGGAFVPLLALVRNGKFFNDQFEARVKVQLLPLQVVRAQRKMQVTECAKPQHELGHLFLHIKLKLKQPSVKLLYLSPFTQPVRRANAHVSNPVAVIMSAAEALWRANIVSDYTVWLDAADSLRESPLCMIALQFWLAFTVIQAPLAMWPFLVVLLLPLLSWKLHCAWKENGKELQLYADETKKDNRSTMHAIADAQVAILGFTEWVVDLCTKVEKLKFVLSVVDKRTTLLFIPIILCSLIAGVALQLAILFGRFGLMRPSVWLIGAHTLLPRAGRQAIEEAWERFQARWMPASEGEETEQAAWGFLWRYLKRIPDMDEETHLQLCERFAIEVLED